MKKILSQFVGRLDKCFFIAFEGLCELNALCFVEKVIAVSIAAERGGITVS